jgi:hypothetical protein
MAGNLSGIIRDPAVTILQAGISHLNKFFGHLPFTGEMYMKGQVQKLKSLLHEYKYQSEFGFLDEANRTRESINTLVNA